MKKRYYVVKGECGGDAGQADPFYSSVLTEREIQDMFDYVENPEVRQRMVDDLKKQMILMEEKGE